MPSVDAMSATTSASSRIMRRICLPVAPIARNRPNSRVRWVTMMRNVLTMMYAPTNSEISAKAIAKMLM